MMNGINDELILAARLLLATLFLIFGWRKLRDFPSTVNQMAQLGVPTPLTAAAVAEGMAEKLRQAKPPPNPYRPPPLPRTPAEWEEHRRKVAEARKRAKQP